jgi:hypothetical protein
VRLQTADGARAGASHKRGRELVGDIMEVGMARVVEQNIVLDPVRVTLFRGTGVMLPLNGFTDLIQQCPGTVLHLASSSY